MAKTGSMLHISNRQARQLWLDMQGLGCPPCGKRTVTAFADRVSSLGMVQLDSIGILARAHHHILWSRQSAYRPKAYDKLMQGERAVFEHFSHDAVILPMSTYPYWQRQHTRRAAAYSRGGWGKKIAHKQIQQQIMDYIGQHGALCSRDFAHHQKGPVDRSVNAWSRPAHKHALDYLWLSGALSVSHRTNFTKYYDLTERIVPEKYRNASLSEQSQTNWLCENALQRLGFGTAAEIQRFWEACDISEVKTWLQRPTTPVVSITYKDHVGNRVEAYAPSTIEARLSTLATPTQRVRIVSPFDPAVRDRDRLKRLFGFDYRIEIYTPPAKRRYGYYVYPMIEGDKIIGRIDVRTNRDSNELDVKSWWLEPGVKQTPSRVDRIVKELERLAKLAGVDTVSQLPSLSENPD